MQVRHSGRLRPGEHSTPGTGSVRTLLQGTRAASRSSPVGALILLGNHKKSQIQERKLTKVLLILVNRETDRSKAWLEAAPNALDDQDRSHQSTEAGCQHA